MAMVILGKEEKTCKGKGLHSSVYLKEDLGDKTRTGCCAKEQFLTRRKIVTLEFVSENENRW